MLKGGGGNTQLDLLKQVVLMVVLLCLIMLPLEELESLPASTFKRSIVRQGEINKKGRSECKVAVST